MYIIVFMSFIVVSQRQFHAAVPVMTGKTVEATSKTFAELVNKADHPVIVDFYAE